jgi:hypothetical protein
MINRQKTAPLTKEKKNTINDETKTTKATCFLVLPFPLRLLGCAIIKICDIFLLL